eukprot:GGOE01019333.1.p1 GENE.GGOE01019333.1~~GGOE01019333.1.p1  ORF type:complete len:422 (+),score=73.98 GGOE01019333.1:52-1317(+)
MVCRGIRAAWFALPSHRCCSQRTLFTTAEQQWTRGVVLQKRPAPNSPVTAEQFLCQQVPVSHDGCPTSSPHLLVQTLFLSVDPYLRCRFNEHTGVDYTTPFQVGSPICSSAIGYVRYSSVKQFKKGDLVMEPFDGWPWQEMVRVGPERAATLRKVPPGLALMCPITFALGCIGQTGLSAYFGMLHECRPKPTDCVIVSGAAGAVGSIAGQLAKLRGCRVIGIAGTFQKCSVLTIDLGFDAAANYKAAGFAAGLRDVVGPMGANVYFDNVGGPVSDAVVPCLRHGAHIVLCGQIAAYDCDSDKPYPPPLNPAGDAVLAQRGITRRPYLVLDYASQLLEGVQTLLLLVVSGKLTGLEHFHYGIENAPTAFLNLMAGQNTGKQLVEVSPLPFGRAKLYGWLRTIIPRFLLYRIARLNCPEAEEM